jgi:murein DD-endopeptidase MepM/ murein hydrolase activator NlpD
VVRRASARGGYGAAVEIDHGAGLTTLYAHASEVLVRAGDTVEPGQAIARVGHTGRATGPHLHFEVRLDGAPVDPARALKKYALRADALVDTGS